MKLSYVNNPMYALCLLAAVCVRQHVQNGVQPLTKSVSLQKPTTVFMKPNKASLRTVNDIQEVKPNVTPNTRSYPNLQEANALVTCVQNYTKRTEKVDDIPKSLPTKKIFRDSDSFFPYNVPDWMLFLFTNIGAKWFA
ncbi:uncharacterized protein LOC105662943 isoform X2 [Megachile rotundata]|uniref:uncharacterized protein LOC105662943 isoform X2 n=1 Tax=Megachile rotundata TaxID=143995 RepID=UPI003FD5F191